MSSMSMKLVGLILRLQGKKGKQSKETYRARYEGREYPQPPKLPKSLLRLCRIEQNHIDGSTVYTFTPKENASEYHIIYTHGGSYVETITHHHWNLIHALIQASGATVTVPLYPLAPENDYHKAFSLLEKIYRAVIAEVPPNRVILSGDSAGGGLAMGSALQYRDQGLPMPGRILLFSPWLDLSMSNPDAAAVEGRDVMLALPGLIQAGEWWAGGEDPKSPQLSPLFADLKGLPPIDLFQGTHDVFIADAREFENRVHAAGGEIHLYEYQGAFHVFVAVTFTPEARDAYRRIAGILQTAAAAIS